MYSHCIQRKQLNPEVHDRSPPCLRQMPKPPPFFFGCRRGSWIRRLSPSVVGKCLEHVDKNPVIPRFVFLKTILKPVQLFPGLFLPKFSCQLFKVHPVRNRIGSSSLAGHIWIYGVSRFERYCKHFQAI